MRYRYRLLLDESMEYEVRHILADAGHDVVHVEDELGKGVTDGAIARQSLKDHRFVVTYDEHFVTNFDQDDYLATLFFEDASMLPSDVARTVEAMAEFYPPDEIRGLIKVGREWLPE